MKIKLLYLTLLFSLNLHAKERIITLSPAINEVVFALGKGKLIVANTDHATYPAESKKIPKVGGYFGVSLEKLISYKPTLVLLQKNNTHLAQTLKRYQIKTVNFSISSLKSIKDMILTIGNKLDIQQKAKKIIENIDNQLKHLKHKKRDKTLLFIFGASGDLKRPMYCAGKDLYFDELIDIAGYKNAVNFTKTQPIGLEKLLFINPDVIIIADSSITEDKKENILNKWYKLPLKASKNHHVFILNKIYQTMPSDRIALFINDLAKVLPID